MQTRESRLASLDDVAKGERAEISKQSLEFSCFSSLILAKEVTE